MCAPSAARPSRDNGEVLAKESPRRVVASTLFHIGDSHMAEKPSGPPSSEFKTREPSTDDLLEESLRIQSAISNTLLDIGDKLNADNVGRGHVLLEVSANLPKNKCGSK